ncbi:MAG: helix-turn-helix transcriptional regulator [Alistipes senegalensis]|nr:helix-turn-helix transcriptional regulator [Alistipes senegalensis]
MEIGERLRSIRKSKGLSIYKLSQDTGISQNHISDLELGRRKPSVETLKRLIIPLGITLSELFNENSEVSILTEKERELIENYRTLPDNKAESLLNLSRLLNE